MSHFKKNRGLTLIEIIIAIAIIGGGLFGVMELFGSTIRTNESNKERIIATNLAREGIEAVRYLRDTNWLYKSGQKRVCWNFWNKNDGVQCKDEKTNSTGNPPPDGMNDQPFIAQEYIIDINPSTFTWSLTKDSTPTIDSNNQLYLTTSAPKDIYTHQSSSNTPTLYFRQIKLSYSEGGTTKGTDNLLRVTSIVKWGNHQVQLETILTDFLERSLPNGHAD